MWSLTAAAETCFRVCLSQRAAMRNSLNFRLISAHFANGLEIQVGSVKVSTVQLVQYVANTLGGAHFDPEGKSPKSRKPVFDLLRRLEAGEFGGLPFQVNDRNLLHHEMLSVAQVLIRSPEVERLSAWRAPLQKVG